MYSSKYKHKLTNLMPHISGKESPPMSHTERHPIVPSTPEGITEDGITSREAALARVLESRAEAGTAQRPTPTREASQGSTERSGFGWKKPIAAVALLAAGAGIFGATRGGEEPTPGSEREPSVSATQNPGETEASQEAEPTSFALSGPEAYQTAPEKIAEDYFDRFNSWLNSGYSADAVNDPRRQELGDEAFGAIITEPLDTQFANEMFVSDWTSNPNLTQFYDGSLQNHYGTFLLALKTAPVEDGGVAQVNEEQYQRSATPDMDTAEIITADESVISLRVDWQGSDNQDKNRAEELNGGFNPNEEAGSYMLTFVDEGGQMKLSDISYN